MNKINVLKISILIFLINFISCRKFELKKANYADNLTNVCIGKMSEQTIYHQQVFIDEFDGQDHDPDFDSSACFTQEPSCSAEFGFRIPHNSHICKPEQYNQQDVKDINKCLWHFYQGWSPWTHIEVGDSAEANAQENAVASKYGVAYTAKNVVARDGKLYLKASANTDYDPSKPLDCGYPYQFNVPGWGIWGRGTNCPNAVGKLFSAHYDNDKYYGINGCLKKKGHDDRYGRIEVFAQVVGGDLKSKVKYVYPAIWMMPDDILNGAIVNDHESLAKIYYPYTSRIGDGEIDIWEANVMSKGPDQGFQTYHYWTDTDGWTARSVYLDQREYHKFGVEWRPGKVMYYVDDCITNIVDEGDLAESGKGRDKVMKISDVSTFLILGVGLPGDYFTTEKKPDTEFMVVDWVKIFK